MAKTGQDDMNTNRSPEDRIAEEFNKYFSNFEIGIRSEDVVVGTRRSIGKRGWRINFRIYSDDSGLPCLEFYAVHRMTSDRHVRIRADGVTQELDAILESYGYDPKVPGSEQAAKENYLRHNRAVASELQARGLYPEGDINSFLRTDGDGPA